MCLNSVSLCVTSCVLPWKYNFLIIWVTFCTAGEGEKKAWVGPTCQFAYENYFNWNMTRFLLNFFLINYRNTFWPVVCIVNQIPTTMNLLLSLAFLQNKHRTHLNWGHLMPSRHRRGSKAQAPILKPTLSTTIV